MKVPVLIKRVEGNGFVALSSLGLTAEGVTPAEAVQKLKDVTQRTLADGLV